MRLNYLQLMALIVIAYLLPFNMMFTLTPCKCYDNPYHTIRINSITPIENQTYDKQIQEDIT
jgi:hypothetical protein